MIRLILREFSLLELLLFYFFLLLMIGNLNGTTLNLFLEILLSKLSILLQADIVGHLFDFLIQNFLCIFRHKLIQVFLSFLRADHQFIIYNYQFSHMKTLDLQSNEGIIFSLLGWKPCYNQIQTYQNCKKNIYSLPRQPTVCYNQAKSLQICYSEKAMKIQPVCLPIFNDTKECLFQGDSYVYSCKQQINELIYCNQNPVEYKDFLLAATPVQKKSKSYDFFQNVAKYQKYS